MAAFYGMRRSKIIGLKWNCIDFDKKTISIQHIVTDIYLDGHLIEDALIALKEQQRQQQKLCGNAYNKDYLEYVLRDYKQFHTRCKPTSSNKQNYTEEERKRILEYLSSKKDIYSQAIKLAFYLCLRIGELVSIKKSDIQGNEIFINRSTRRHQKMNDDLSFGKTEYTIEERIKGNQKEGFRSIPLTKKAPEIVDETIHLYPEGEYLFMRDGKPIYGDTFNRHLKSICKALDIPYRSSHQIRFTMATTLYEGGVKINQLSTFLGHSDTRTTFHYIRQKKADEHASQIMTDILDI